MRRVVLLGVPACVLVLALVSARAAAGPRSSSTVASPTVKILVDKDGWYRVPRASLESAGFVFPANLALLDLTSGGQEVAFEYRGGALEFYGQALDTTYTDTRTYWLSVGGTPGLPVQFSRARAPASAPQTSFSSTVVVKDRKAYRSDIVNGPGNNFFGDSITPTASVSRVIQSPHVDTTQTASLRVDLQATSLGSHSINVAINGHNLGSVTGADVQAMTATFTGISGAWLNDGPNTVLLTDPSSTAPCTDPEPASGTTCPTVLTDTFTLTYGHLATADSDAVRFPVTPAQSLSIGGFTTSGLRLLDLTNPVQPRELLPAIRPAGAGYTISLTAPGVPSQLYAFPDAAALTPKAVIQDEPSDLKTPNHQADLVIISYKDFIPSLTPLVTQRSNEGLTVVVVDVQNVFDEFSFGAHDPTAIHDFLQYAKNNWTVGPSYALLVGDASLDPRNFLGQGSFDFVPTVYVTSNFNPEPPSDDSMADFDGNGVPEIAVGRLPARTAADADLMVQKIVDYASLVRPKSAVLVADDFSRSDYHFDQFSDDLASTSLTPNGVSIDKVYRSTPTYPTNAAARTAIITKASSGPTIVNWFGHGSIFYWASDTPKLLQNSDVPLITNNGKPSIYLMMTCQNGYFVNQSLSSLAEVLLLAPNGAGAVASWASSGDTTPSGQVVAAKIATNELLSNPNTRLGEAMRDAKAAVTPANASDYLDVRHTWTLLGDPTMRLR